MCFTLSAEHSPHEAAPNSIQQQANTDAFELQKTAVLTGGAMRQNPSERGRERRGIALTAFPLILRQSSLSYTSILQGKTKWS